MTDRELDAAVAKVLGWREYLTTNAGVRLLTPEDAASWGDGKSRPATAADTSRKGIYDGVPDYSSDPAAAAEVKRWLWGQGWDIKVETLKYYVYLQPLHATLRGVDLQRVDIDGDPIVAECRVLCLAALAVAGKVKA